MPDSRMRWSIRWQPPAVKDAERLDSLTRRRIVKALDRYIETEHGDVVALTGIDPPEYRLRVGDWRIRFRRDTATATLFVLRVLHRSAAYR